MESKQTPTIKKSKNSICSGEESNISLYLGASALFISVITVIFFYREIRKLKKDVGDIKQIKNQLSNVDSRFDVIDSSIEEISKMISRQKIIEQNTQEPKKNVQFKIPETVSIIEENTLLEEEDSEVEVESVDDN